MKFTLKDYQADAVRGLLTELEKAKELYHSPTMQESSVSLTAPTGAGKTVIAAATIEALFFGSDEFDFQADPGAVVIWFSDSPALNEQSMFRLMEASEKLTWNRLKTVKPPFSMKEFDSGTVYFLNAQRLGKKSLLTRGYSSAEEEFEEFGSMIQPDDQPHTIWETIANTIENENKTVYMVLDEAHRGYDKAAVKDRLTIVRRLVDGLETETPMPIVLGVSATIERFKKVMSEASAVGGRTSLDDVIIEPSRVIESGLLKDSVLLEIPGEEGDLYTNLVREAAKKLRESTEAWSRYCARERLSEVVSPLMVLQVENTPEVDRIARALDIIREELPELNSDNVRHVFAEKRVELFGAWEIDSIEPTRVQQTPTVRVLLAKEAISTGWDCPRAEVLLSFRPAKDQTHIAQLLGRMVRSPLARRIPGNDKLNSVDCILPYFDKTTAGKIVRYITGAENELPTSGGGVTPLVAGRFLEENPKLEPAVWGAFDRLASQSVPKRGVRPIKRLISLAHAIASDQLEESPIADVELAVHSLLNDFSKSNKILLDAAVREINEVLIEVLRGRNGRAIEYSTRSVRADELAILEGFEEAKRVFGADIATSYVNHLTDSSGGGDDALLDAYVKVAALARISKLHETLDELAIQSAEALFKRHNAAIRALSDERQTEYEMIRSMATEPQLTSLRRPINRAADFGQLNEAGEIVAAPLVERHLMADSEGKFPVQSLNGWEREVIDMELARETSVAWYRNPAHNGADSLTVAYRNAVGEWRSLHPDFVFFNRTPSGEIESSIVDPHATNLEDWRVKLIGLADFAERHGHSFARIQSVVKHNGKWRALEMKREDVRATVRSFTGDATHLYMLGVSEEYV